MKILNKYTQHGKVFTYIVDEELSIGIYKTTETEYLNLNDKTLLNNHNIKYDKFYRINDGVLIMAKTKNNSRIDFLITEDICFKSLQLISEHGFDGQFYNDFKTAFNMLDKNQFEDGIWYD
ncbi:hypothetical protein WNY78_11380 [Psychroserpens sp. AS72]|uniref:hypothetical protein n=1 Tax=Psychroserpens sp. AS72 TaxID=3135775 RepID=UPI00317C2426